MTARRMPLQPSGYSLRWRLYALIVFLGLLPVFGAAVALVDGGVRQRDDTALASAVHSATDLERVDRSVYAVVIESRGIYMSPDWKTAAPFAANLGRDLDALRQAGRAWEADAIAWQQANVEELADRIDAFIDGRTELLRRAREEGTASARAYGDNDANRSVSSALEESLGALLHAYEADTGRARARLAADDRIVLVMRLALAGLGLLALGTGVIFVRSEVLAPVLRIRGAMLRLARGDLGIAADHDERSRELGDMAAAVSVFREALAERQKSTRETRLLSELNEWLQSCNSLGELFAMVAEFLGRSLPDCAGSLYVYANSRDVLEGATVWNGGRVLAAMHPDDCWALRRGRPYTLGESEIDFLCGHVDPATAHLYCCIPILAHGETVGLMHLEFGGERRSDGTGAPAPAVADQRRLGIVCAEQISLAIANVKLRDQLRDQSIRDALTGLFNRRYLLETCRREFARAQRAGQSVAVLSLDIDHFKKYNDNHGHDAGDTVLRAVAGCLDALFRDDDVACRFGGEEFVVLLPGADLAAAARRAEELRGRIAALVVRYLEENLPRITVSIGVATFPQAGDTPQEVLRAADEALYRAKEGGRNRVELGTADAPSRAPAAAARPMPRALAPSFYVAGKAPEAPAA